MGEKLKPGKHVITQGDRHRECVEITGDNKKNRRSKTYHQTKISGMWTNNPLYTYQVHMFKTRKK